MSEKVPLHIYEKTKKSKKRLDLASNILLGIMASAVILFGLYLIGVLFFGIWVGGFGGWMLLVLGVIGAVISGAIKNSQNREIIDAANLHGVIDE